MKKFLFKLLAISLVWEFANCNDEEEKFLYQSSGKEDETLVVMTTSVENDDEISTKCLILTDKDEIYEELKSSSDLPVQQLSEDKMENIIRNCEINSRRERRQADDEGDREDEDTFNGVETTTEGYDGWPIIFPGTKWCGAGDIAKNYSDLGLHQDTDRCCRAHDLCNDTLAPGETRNNLTNKSPFTKLSCKCDNDFYDCLDKVNSVTSNIIGNKYFNILMRSCYAEDYPKKCTKMLFKIKCLKYEKDTSVPKEMQWISARKYKKIPIPGPITITLPF